MNKAINGEQRTLPKNTLTEKQQKIYDQLLIELAPSVYKHCYQEQIMKGKKYEEIDYKVFGTELHSVAFNMAVLAENL